MKQRYAYLREIPHILAAWIEHCPYVDVQQKYIAYMHEEAPHPEYLVDFAKEMGRDPKEMRQAVLIPEFTTPYFYYWLSRGHIVEVAAANNFGNERTNTRKGRGMYEATAKYYPYPSLIKFFEDHAEEEGDHANLGVYVLKKYATTDELQDKATAAAKKSLQLKILGQNASMRAIHHQLAADEGTTRFIERALNCAAQLRIIAICPFLFADLMFQREMSCRRRNAAHRFPDRLLIQRRHLWIYRP